MKENSINGDKETIERLELYSTNYKRVLEENEQLRTKVNSLKEENVKLRVIRNTTDYGVETINLIPKSSLVEINTNRYMIEIEDKNFVDLKQVYQENKILKELHVQDNKHLDFIMKNSIPVQKVREKQKEKEWALESYDCTEANYKQSQAIGAWQALQELLESE